MSDYTVADAHKAFYQQVRDVASNVSTSRDFWNKVLMLIDVFEDKIKALECEHDNCTEIGHIDDTCYLYRCEMCSRKILSIRNEFGYVVDKTIDEWLEEA